MYGHPHELERVLVKRTVSHCDTCLCSQDRELRMLSQETRWSPRSSRIHKWESYSEFPARHCTRSCFCDNSCCCLQTKRPRRVASLDRKISSILTVDKYSLMEKWFQRFDFDEDGFLEPEDLRSLFRYLIGVTVPLSKCERILDEADMNGDGLLSFKEFLLLWHRAAYHEHELLAATDCDELLDIAREFNLYPDIPCTRCDGRKPRWVNNDKRSVMEDTIICNCGYEKNITPFVKIFDDDRKKEDRRTSDDEKIPILSGNCNTFG